MNNKIGEVFCKFYTEWIAYTFKKTISKVYLKFGQGEEENIRKICEGNKQDWKDARLTSDSNELKGEFSFYLNEESGEEDKKDDLKPFLEFVIKEIENVFKDLLYLEAVEERIKKIEEENRLREEQDWGVQVQCNDRLVIHLIGNLLDREWLTIQYAKEQLRENKLPEADLLIQISAQKYEQRLVETKMFFYSEKNKIPEKSIQFDPELDASREDRQIALKNLRTVRKMMEMAGKDHGLVICCEEGKFYIDGIMRAPDNNADNNEVLAIAFDGHLKWRLIKGKSAIFTYCEGKFQIPALDGEEQDGDIEDKLVRLQRHIPELDVENIKNIIEELKNQGHGTSIVFMDQSTLDEEKKRLGPHKRLYNMCTFPLLEHKEEIIGISSIDGAILADVTGRCHAVGAILDGESAIVGNAGRGARHNSVENYVNVVLNKYTKDTVNKLVERWCFAVILSEDKMVSLVAPKRYELEKSPECWRR